MLFRKIVISVGLMLGMVSQAGAIDTDWGVYQIFWRPSQFERELDKQLEMLGGQPSYVLFFRDLHPKRGFPTQAATICQSRHLTPMISLELWIWGETGKNVLREIVDGKHDEFFRAWASGAKAWGHRCILRFGFEMNGEWFPWGRQPELFKKAWIYTHTLFVEEGADQVQWMFSPNVLYDDSKPLVDFRKYYPGHGYVDLIGLDGYNFGDDHDRWHKWTSGKRVFDESVKAASVWGKPIFLSEVGCADGSRKPTWMKSFLSWIEAESVEAFIYFNYDKRREGEPNWRLDSNAKSLQVFRAAVTGDENTP